MTQEVPAGLVPKNPASGCRCGCCESTRKFRAKGQAEVGCFCQHDDPAGYDVCGCDYCLERGRFAH